MIYEVDGSILTDMSEKCVILNQCNAKGWIGTGISAKIHSKYPQAFKDYHEYCRWFSDGHEKEIMGTWARTQINENLIICNAITQIASNKSKHETDYESWHEILRKLKHQTHYINKKFGTTWTIHVSDKIGCGAGGADYDVMHQLFEMYFGDSSVNIVFHKY